MAPEADTATDTAADTTTDDKTADQQTDQATDTTTDTAAADDKGADTATDKAADTDTADWRTRIAGDDEKLLKHLGRYQTEKAFADAARKDREAARNALKPLGDDPTEEELAAYRKNFGIPDKAEAYLENMPDGLVIGDDDKPVLNDFAEAAHKLNLPKSASDGIVQWYYGVIAKQSEAASEADTAAKAASEDALRQEWGNDYRRNINATDAFLATLPGPVQEALTQGYGPDGTSLANNAELIKWLCATALDRNPLITVVGASGDQGKAIADEIADIEKQMRTNRKAYNENEAMQARYRELITAREKLAA